MGAFAVQRGVVVDICNRKTYRLVAAFIDLFSLIIAWELVVYLRVLLNPVMRFHLTIGEVWRLTPPFLELLIVWASVALVVNSRPDTDDSIGAHIFRILQTWGLASTLITASTFMLRYRGEGLSRSFAILFPFCSLTTLLLGRYMALLAAPTMERKYLAAERVGFVGDGAGTWALIDRITSSGDASICVAGVVLPAASAKDCKRPVPVLGDASQLAAVINRARLNRLIIADDQLDAAEVDECIHVARRMSVNISRAVVPHPDVTRLQFTRLCGLQLLEFKSVAFTRRQEIIKRAVDIVAASLTMAALLPLVLLIAILIKITSVGPVLYASRRVGKGGKHFTFLKFRSMRVRTSGDEQAFPRQKDGHIFKLKKDPRVTPLGSFLRRYSLDELPQLVNVLKGDMSLVGPRPLPAEDLDADGQSSQFRSWSAARSKVLPGITGLWQVRGRSDAGFDRMMQLDAEYIQNWSLAFDLKILLETPIAVLSSRGAY
jgi:exopolysaccharide biosynthesis polyprenyl glycosylphosphotransferase